jgi:FdhE protein
MTDLWDKFTQRATELASQRPESGELLRFYARLLEAQGRIHSHLASAQGWLPSGVLAEDLGPIRATIPDLLSAVKAHGPSRLAEEAERLSNATESQLDELLLNYWVTPSDLQFFAKAVLQPYFRRLFEVGTSPVGRLLERAENRCPFCAGQPQLSYLTAQDPASDGGSRQLLCSTCLSSWLFRRVVCANCSEERPERLAYFSTAEYDYVRVDACETCHSYLKSIDLTKLGLAIPLVDEVAAAPLDVWAVEHGYTKIELNLVGL